MFTKHSFEEFRTPLKRTMSDSGGVKAMAEFGGQPAKMNTASACVPRQLAPQTSRPLLGNSQGDLRVKATPPELPLRRGGSVDRVVEAQDNWNSLGRSASGSTTDSPGQ